MRKINLVPDSPRDKTMPKRMTFLETYSGLILDGKFYKLQTFEVGCGLLGPSVSLEGCPLGNGILCQRFKH